MNPESQVWGVIFLGVGAGFLACIFVELASGRGPRLNRALIGIGLAILDIILYFVFVGIAIQAMVGSDPSKGLSGAGFVIVTILAAWVVPAVRLWWLRRGGPPGAA